MIYNYGPSVLEAILTKDESTPFTVRIDTLKLVKFFIHLFLFFICGLTGVDGVRSPAVGTQSSDADGPAGVRGA